jgi:superoxide reductase
VIKLVNYTRAPSLLVGVNTPLDSRNLSDLEKMHLPVITAPQNVMKNEFFDVQVEVGATLAHPSDCGHFIMAIELYADDTFLARVVLMPGAAAPSATLRIRLRDATKDLVAYCACNVHGRWMSSKEITVEL